MIIVRSPLRLPLGGGGTDLPAYYRQYGGALVAAALNKYVYITVNRPFETGIRVKYSQTEYVQSVEEIQHPLVRESLRLLGVGPGLEIVAMADVPANTGLGSSSAFTVSLLHALHTYKREAIPRRQLAEEAFHVEAELVGAAIGKQDQYVAALGGVLSLEIDRDGQVLAQPVELDEGFLHDFMNNVLLFYTGIRRSAWDVIQDQSTSLAANKPDVTVAMHTVKAIGQEVGPALLRKDLEAFGELLDRHWTAKRFLSSQISSYDIDRWYDIGKANGAVGGKLIGAGGGGFLMFCADGHDTKGRLVEAMASEGLSLLRVGVDLEGSKIIADIV